jgi:hypothetical protein
MVTVIRHPGTNTILRAVRYELSILGAARMEPGIILCDFRNSYIVPTGVPNQDFFPRL